MVLSGVSRMRASRSIFGHRYGALAAACTVKVAKSARERDIGEAASWLTLRKGLERGLLESRA